MPITACVSNHVRSQEKSLSGQQPTSTVLSGPLRPQSDASGKPGRINLAQLPRQTSHLIRPPFALFLFPFFHLFTLYVEQIPRHSEVADALFIFSFCGLTALIPPSFTYLELQLVLLTFYLFCFDAFRHSLLRTALVSTRVHQGLRGDLEPVTYLRGPRKLNFDSFALYTRNWIFGIIQRSSYNIDQTWWEPKTGRRPPNPSTKYTRFKISRISLPPPVQTTAPAVAIPAAAPVLRLSPTARRY